MPAYFEFTAIELKLQNPVTDSSQIRVKISFNGDPEITANGPFDIYSGKTYLTTLNSGEIANVHREAGQYRLQAGSTNFLKTEPIRFIPKSNSILKIQNFEHRPGWNPNLNDNEYRGILEVNVENNSATGSDNGQPLIVINELGLEDYLKGLAEISNSEHHEKIKAVIIAARTYARYYTTIDEKFPGQPYDLDDNPDVSQKYLGYGFEKRAPNVVKAIEETAGKVITYHDDLVKTPYFNQSDGTRTRSALDVWGWENALYLVSVDDSFCKGDKFLGHGVGLSGCGAKGMAEAGYTYEEILKHYYIGVEIGKI